MSWFKSIFGCTENVQAIRSQFLFNVDNATLTSVANKKTYHVGRFEVLSNRVLGDRLRSKGVVPNVSSEVRAGLQFRHIVGDIRTLHKDPSNNGAVFQVASQFNCLEMTGPRVTPAEGITCYAYDATQGPACAMSCPAGTIFRNYFVNGTGQCEPGTQIDMLRDAGDVVDNAHNEYWQMSNGYSLPVADGSISALGSVLRGDPAIRQRFQESIQVGVHWATEVNTEQDGVLYELPKTPPKSVFARMQSGAAATSTEAAADQQQQKCQRGDATEPQQTSPKQLVCQVFTSAIPVSYSASMARDSAGSEPLASAALEAAFEGTLAVGHLLSLQRTEEATAAAAAGASDGTDASAGGSSSSVARVKVFLTCVGGGAFGNKSSWIAEALQKSLNKHREAPLDVYLVHYGSLAGSMMGVKM